MKDETYLKTLLNIESGFAKDFLNKKHYLLNEHGKLVIS